MQIPDQILQRCTFQTRSKNDPIEYITHIQPAEPCECGEQLDFVRIAVRRPTARPWLHYRDYCNHCHKCCPVGETVWLPAAEWNEIQREFKRQQKENNSAK